MRKFIAPFSLALLAFAGSVAAKADPCNGMANNLISNCSFESGTFASWSGTTPTDGNSYVDSVDPIDQSAAYAGTEQAFLGDFDATSTLSQTLSTVAGRSYIIEFALANDIAASNGYLNSLAVSFGSTTLLSETDAAASSYSLYEYLVTATGSSTTLTFTSRNDDGYFDLDSVSVTATPEPSSFLLMGTGLLGAVGVVRRRLQA